MRAITDPSDYSQSPPVAIIVHALGANSRPVGFAPWPEYPKEKRKKAKKRAKSV